MFSSNAFWLLSPFIRATSKRRQPHWRERMGTHGAPSGFRRHRDRRKGLFHGGRLCRPRRYARQSARVLDARWRTGIRRGHVDGRADSATLALRANTLAALREKHGEQIEIWWQETFGYRFDCLTESEARYLVRVEDADAIRERLIAAGSEEHD